MAYDRAIQLASDELKVNPTDTKIRAVLAVCLAKRGEKARAQSEINVALQQNPNNPGVMFKAGVIANLAHRDDEALRWIDRALRAGYSRTEVSKERDLDNLRDGRLQQLLQQTASLPIRTNS